jgi:hypothetical protein
MTNTDDISARQLREIFHPIFVDQRDRDRVTSTPAVLEATGDSRDEELLRMSGLTDRPTVVLFLTRSGTRRLDDVRRAVDDPDAARALALQFAVDTEKRQEGPMKAAVEDLLSQPVYADFRYGDFTLAEHLFVPPEYDLVPFVFPYNGGHLTEDAFQLVQWRKRGSDAELTGLAVHYSPLSAAEREAALREPAVVQPEAICDTTWVTVAAGVALMTAGLAAAAGPSPTLLEVKAAQGRTSGLPDQPSAADLIGFRIDRLTE